MLSSVSAYKLNYFSATLVVCEAWIYCDISIIIGEVTKMQPDSTKLVLCNVR